MERGLEVLAGADRVRVGVDLGVDVRGVAERVRVGVDLGVDVRGVAGRVRVGVDLGLDVRGVAGRVRVGVDLGVDVRGVADRVRGGVDLGVDVRGVADRVRVGVDLGLDVRGVADRVRVGVAGRDVPARSGRLDRGVAVRGALGAASRPRIASSTRRAGVGLRLRSIVPPLDRGAATRTGAFSPALPGASTATVGFGAGAAVRPPLLTRAGFGVSARRILVVASDGAAASVGTEPALRGWIVVLVVPLAARRISSGAVRRSVTPGAEFCPAPVTLDVEPARRPPAVTPTRPDRLGSDGATDTVTVSGSASTRLSLV